MRTFRSLKRQLNKALIVFAGALFLPGSTLAVQYGERPEAGDLFSKSTVSFYASGHATCSGVAIAPDVILTAKHCIHSNTTERIMISRYSAGYAGPVEESYPDNVISKHSKFDLALVTLKRPIDGISVAKFEESQLGYTKSDAYCLIGAGGTEERNGNIGGLLRRLCELRIAGFDNNQNLIYLNKVENLKAGADRGDSGGPVFIQLEDGPHLIGILSVGILDENGARYSGFVDLQEDSIRDWIKESEKI